jgi:hypothetical protein
MLGLLNLFADLQDEEHPREANDASEQGESLSDNAIPIPRNK